MDLCLSVNLAMIPIVQTLFPLFQRCFEWFRYDQVMIAEFLTDSGDLVILKMFVLEDVGTMNLFMIFPEADPNINAGAEAPLLLAARNDQVGGTKMGDLNRFSHLQKGFFFKNDLTVAGWLLIYCSFFLLYMIWYDKLRINKDSVWNSMSLFILRRW